MRPTPELSFQFCCFSKENFHLLVRKPFESNKVENLKFPMQKFLAFQFCGFDFYLSSTQTGTTRLRVLVKHLPKTIKLHLLSDFHEGIFGNKFKFHSASDVKN